MLSDTLSLYNDLTEPESLFPGKPHSEPKYLAPEYCHNLCDVILETVKSLTLSGAELRRRFRFKNTQTQADRSN